MPPGSAVQVSAVPAVHRGQLLDLSQIVTEKYRQADAFCGWSASFRWIACTRQRIVPWPQPATLKLTL